MFARILLTMASLLFAISAQAFTPRTGIWWNPGESGSGYNIEVQDGTLVVLIFSYKSNGDSEWYISSGSLSPSNSFTGPLNKVRNGQCIACAYANPSTVGSDGTITINFTSEMTATVSLPGGRVTNIQSDNFAHGVPPQGMLGEWVFVEAIGSSYFADHYNFTTIGSSTSTGNGVVMDLSRYAACEMQVSGSFAGQVVCFHWSSSSLTTVSDQYVFRFGLDQTFNGAWVSPTTYNNYTMKGHLWANSAGVLVSGQATPALQGEAQNAGLKPLAEQAAMAGRRSEIAGASAMIAMQAIAGQLRARLSQQQ